MGKEYASYTTVDQKWIERIPAHWEMKRLKGVFAMRKERNNPIQTDYILSLTAKQGVVPYAEKEGTGGNKPKDDLTQYNICRENDLLVNCMNVVSGAAGVSRYYGAISPVYYAFYPREDENIWYYHYIFRLITFQRSLIGLGKGILMHESDEGVLTSVRMRISMNYLGNVLLPIPPREEQDQIVRFLDWKVSGINRLIGIKRRQIEELKNLRFFFISKAVTNGIDANGIINDASIGRQWARVKIGYKAWIRARLGWRGLKATEYVEEGYPFLSAFNIVDDKLVWDNLNFINKFRYDESPEIKLSVGDILLVKDGAGIGKCARIDDLPFGESTPNGSLAVITPYEELSYKYLYYYLVSNEFKNAINKIITGMGVPHLTQHFLKNVEIPCPPLDMQEAIALYLDEKCRKLDAMVAIKDKEINELNELHVRLVADAVTGKIDVRSIDIPDYEFVADEMDVDTDVEDDTEEQED